MVWTRIVDSISGRLAFFPPTPPSYLIEAHGDGAHGELYLAPAVPGLRKVPRAQVARVPVSGGAPGDTIVAAFVPAPAGVRFTLLCSHGNAVDLGQMLPLYDELARILRVNIMAYDYRGYGLSSGVPAASAALADAAAALGHLLERHGRVRGDVVLYGQSVGTGPTSWLAARTPGLAGVVLHSPFLSGLRVIKPGYTRWPAWADIFPNFKYVPKIAAKTLIMHVSLAPGGKGAGGRRSSA